MTYDGFISYSHAADDLLAPRLQAGLQKFAKPWWKRRAIRIFRDESSLSANPHLWSSITEALDSSGWFVLLLSPDAARSEWVNQEIAYWVTNREPGRILPVVTGGEFGWAEGDVAGSAVPDALRGVFEAEPRWVDLRFAKGEEQLDLQDPRFADAIADVASAIRGVAKDELTGEEVRQHRRTVRTAWAAGVVVLALGVVASVFGVVASNERGRADQEAVRANEEASRANQEAERATNEADRASQLARDEAAARAEADTNADRAEMSAALAHAHELAASAIGVLEDDQELALLLSLASLAVVDESISPVEARVALRRALYGHILSSRVVPLGGEQAVNAALSADGSRLAWLSEESVTVRVLDTESWEEVWVHSEAKSNDFPSDVYFSSDGTQVAYSVVDASALGFGSPRSGEDDEHGARIVFLDAESGEEIDALPFDGPCPAVVLGPQSPDGAYWPVISSDSADCETGGELWSLQLRDTETLGLTASLGPATPSLISWSADSSRLSMSSYWGFGARVFDVAIAEVVLDIPDLFLSTLSPDGSYLASMDGFTPSFTVAVHEVATGKTVDRFLGLTDAARAIQFSADGSLLAAASRGEGGAVWNMTTGVTEHRLGGVSGAVGVFFDEFMQRLVHVGEGEIAVFDLSGLTAGEGGTQRWGVLTQANAFASAGTTGAALAADTDDWAVVVFDGAEGRLTGAVAPVDMGRAPAVLPDGRVVVFRRQGVWPDGIVGPVSVWDPLSDSYVDILGCAGFGRDRPEVECVDGGGEFFSADRFHLSPEGDRFLVTSESGKLVLFDANTFDPLSEASIDPAGQGGVEAFGGDWIAVSTGSPAELTTELMILSMPELDEIAVIPGGLVALSSDARLIATPDGRGSFAIYETDSWKMRVASKLGEARIRGLEFSPDGSKLMTAGTDGFVRIWSAIDGAELDRIPIGNVSDGYWIDEQHLFVATIDGLWTTISLDVREVASLALNRLTRSPTADECQTYRIDPCPTLEEMKSR